MYNVMSPKAEEFISDEEILECLDYAEKNKNNRALIEQILEKAAKMKGVSHKEAIVLLDCELDDLNEKIYALAEKIKKEFYGNRIVMFAPLYLSNYCINGCEYCPYHARNKHITRKKMTQEEIKREVIAGHCNERAFGPPWSFTSTSTCPWIGHPVSGLLPPTSCALFTLGFPTPSVLNTLSLLITITRRTILQKVPHHPLPHLSISFPYRFSLGSDKYHTKKA